MNKLLLLISVFSFTIAQDCCEAEQEAIDNCGGLGCFIPQCTNDCEWESMQCWSSTGYCWCVDEDGIEIDGTSQPSWQGLPECNNPLEECIDLTNVPFGWCDMVLGIGYVNGECNYVSGCGWQVEGIDYTDAFFNSMEECESIWYTDCDMGDMNEDGNINVIDIVQIVNIILSTEEPSNDELCSGDINEDGNLNVMDIVSLVQMILNPEDSVQINSGTTFGECLGYCSFSLELDDGFASFTATGWDLNGVLPDLFIDESLSDNSWQYLLELIDFEYFQSLDDVYGCPDCDDGGAEYIEIIYNGISKQITFPATDLLYDIHDLTLYLRQLREDYWNQLNEPQLPESCYLEPDGGPCFGYIPMYYYNSVSGQCEMFVYGGCAGVVPFESLGECQNTCE